MESLALLTILIFCINFMRSFLLKLFQELISLDLRRDVYSIFIKNDLNFF